MAKTQTLGRYLLPALPMLLAVAVYAFSVRLPFFWDDVPHFLASKTMNGFNQWGDFPSFPYYRPVVFSVWKLFEILLGHNDPVILHLVNIFVFGLSGVVLTQLVQYLVADVYAGTLAGFAFVLFPFSYRAIPLVGALFHLLLVLGFLLSFYLALLWIDHRVGRWGLLTCLLSAFLAVFSHENGVLLVPLFLGLLAVKYFATKPDVQRIVFILFSYAIISGAYFFLWFFAFRPQGSEQSLTEAFDVALAVLLQGLVYPFPSLLRPFIHGDIAPSSLIALILIVVGVALLAIQVVSINNRGHSLRVCLFGLTWYVLTVLPAGLFLSAGYVLGSPRLTMLASVGGSVFWTVVIVTLYQQTRFPRLTVLYRVFAIGIIGLFVYVSVEFLLMRRDDFLQMGAYQWQLQDILSQQVINPEDAVFVNLPDYITPTENNRRFLLGTEGVLFVNPDANYGEQLNVNAESDVDYSNVTVLSYPAIVRNEGFDFFAHPPALDTNGVAQIIQEASDVIVTQFYEDSFYPLYVGGTASIIPSDVPFAEFGDGQVYLTQAQVILNTLNDTIDITIQWEVNIPLGIKLFIHVYCDDAFIAQSDGYPWGDTYPFAFWEAGETQVDIRRIHLNTEVTESCLRIYAGLYYEADVTRLEAINVSDNTRFPDDMVLLEITAE